MVIDLSLLSYDQFELLCLRLLKAEDFEILKQSYRASDLGIDVIATNAERKKWIVQFKYFQTRLTPSARIRGIANDLLNAKDYLGADSALLIISGALTKMSIDLIEAQGNIIVWDRSKLRMLLDKHTDIDNEFVPIPVIDTIKPKRSASFPWMTVDGRAFLSLHNDQSGERGGFFNRKVAGEFFFLEKQDTRARELLERLNSLKAGKRYWKQYEDLCIEILNFAFIPALRPPKIQSRSEDGLDRRDAIYPIGHSDFFWNYLRSECRTRFVVAEFKNYVDSIGQQEVESIQQYLYTKAMRSFGILCSRRPPSESALIARRRAWLEFDKLIVLLSDFELSEILLIKSKGGDTTDVLEAQLFEFFSALTP